MNISDWALLALVALAFCLALYKIAGDKRRGKACCGSCAGCTAACEKRGGQRRKKADRHRF